MTCKGRQVSIGSHLYILLYGIRKTKPYIVATAMAQEAQAPVITGQPQGFDYYHVYGTGTLIVVANSTDGGMLSYQWYENTTNSNTGGVALTGYGANTSTYYPSPSVRGHANMEVIGTEFYYYVVVTNTNGSQITTTTSNVATVTMVLNTATPITAMPYGGRTILPNECTAEA
jgi:hypothetical protein